MDPQQKVNEIVISRRLGGKCNVGLAVAAYALLDANNEEIEFIIRKAVVTLTNAQIRAIPTTGIEIVAAPGVGKRIAVIYGQALLDNTAGIYGNVDPTFALILRTTGGGSTVAMSGICELEWLFTDGSEKGIGEIPAPNSYQSGGIIAGGSDYASAYENVGVSLRASNGVLGNLTLGDAANTLKVTVYYAIIDL
jgi:hypothetical protein